MWRRIRWLSRLLDGSFLVVLGASSYLGSDEFSSCFWVVDVVGGVSGLCVWFSPARTGDAAMSEIADWGTDMGKL